MAIPSIEAALSNKSDAIKYLNSKEATSDGKSRIFARYGYDTVNKWLSEDCTKYEISDEDFDDAKSKGKQHAKDTTGYNGHKNYRAVGDAITDVGVNVAGMAVKGAADIAISKAAVNAGMKGFEKAAENIAADRLTGKAAKEATKKAVSEAASEGAKEGAKAGIGNLVANTAKNAAKKETEKQLAKNASATAAEEAGKKAGEKVTQGVGKSIGCITGCVLGLAEGTKYTASKPNEDQVDAARVLRDSELPESQEALSEAQANMQDAEEEVSDLTEQANETTESANKKIDEEKTIFDFYRAQYNGLKAKADAGEKLTKDEKSLMKNLSSQMTQNGTVINDTQNETSETVSALSENISEYQNTFDESQETIAYTEGVTDYAEGFDQNTQTMCYVESGVQGINAAMSAKSSYQAFALASSGSWAFGATAWAYAFGVMGATGAALSGKGTLEQASWAKEVGDEIDIRESVQDFNADTTDMHEETINNYAAMMTEVDELELEVPDDMEVPEEPAAAAITSNKESSNANPFMGGNVDNKDDNTKGANGKKKNDDESKGIGLV